MENRDVICKIGEVKAGSSGDRLRATLGSCIGIGLIFRRGGRCALAHCLLPYSPDESAEISGKYVNQAIRSLLSLLKTSKAECGKELEAIVVGGAQMMGQDGSEGTRSIGRQNSEIALQELKKLGIKIVHLDIGGGYGRQIAIDCGTYEYFVRRIEKNAA